MLCTSCFFYKWTNQESKSIGLSQGKACSDSQWNLAAALVPAKVDHVALEVDELEAQVAQVRGPLTLTMWWGNGAPAGLDPPGRLQKSGWPTPS